MPGWVNVRKDPAYNTTAWKKARTACLQRANWRCEIKLDVCIGRATEADHIYGLANDRDHQHLRAACSPCHGKVTGRQGRAAQTGQASQPADPEPRPRTQWAQS